MEFFYENQGVNTYLVYKIKEGDSIDTLSLGMITNNNIPGLIKTIFTQMDEVRFIKYNVSAKISMKQFFTGVVNRKRLLGVFDGIVNALISAEDYMIDISSVILDLDYIFVDVSTCEATLICLPITNNEIQKPDLGAFFKNIMVNTQFDQTENSDHVTKIFNYLNGSPLFSLVDFKKLIDGLKNEQSVNTTPVQQVVSVRKVVQPKPKEALESNPAVNKVQPRTTPVPQPIQINQPKSQPVVKSTVSGTNNVVKPPIQQQSQPVISEEPEKKISMFNLLMHYSKENKALYDQQKAAKKAKNDAQKQAQANQNVNGNASKINGNYGYKIPNVNQNSGNGSFAIPGQPASNIQQPTPIKQQNQPTARPQTQPSQIPAQPVVQQSLQNKPYNQPVQQIQNVQQVQTVQQVQPQGQPMNFGNTTVLNNGKIGETTVLSGDLQQTQAVRPHLLRNKNNEIINLTKPVFRIGKEKSYVDYFVSDNTAVSRSHANIITRGNKYYIVDTNSTNHTFVNEKMIPSNAETEIHHGDKIRLGNENFEFKLY